jgi:hypothetical protein
MISAGEYWLQQRCRPELSNSSLVYPSEPGWRPDMTRGVLRGEGFQAGIGVLTGLLTVALIYLAATMLAG